MTGIPSFVFAVHNDEIPAQAGTCWDLNELVQLKIDEGKAWRTAFENEWQRRILEVAQNLCPTPALNYIYGEVNILADQKIESAIHDLSMLRSFLLSNILTFRRLGLQDNNPFRNLSEKELFESARGAVSRQNADDSEYLTDAEAFFSFLASQQKALTEALTAGMSVIHVQYHG